jgi:5-bromo-4-chloroindolyl phosphate hydrolysis protein
LSYILVLLPKIIFRIESQAGGLSKIIFRIEFRFCGIPVPFLRTLHLKQKAIVILGEKPSKLIRRELIQQQSRGLTASDISKIRKNIYEARTAVQPTLPKFLNKLHAALNGFNHLTINENEPFSLVNDTVQNTVL